MEKYKENLQKIKEELSKEEKDIAKLVNLGMLLRGQLIEMLIEITISETKKINIQDKKRKEWIKEQSILLDFLEKQIDIIYAQERLNKFK